jgi:hypothetical protein
MLLYPFGDSASMLMMARDRSYEELLAGMRGKKVLIWTCNTCARLCNGIGGSESANKLSGALRKDGVDVVGVVDTSASCLRGKVRAKIDRTLIDECDVILSLTCDIGSLNAGKVFGKPVVNPVITFGPGYIDEDGILFLCDIEDGKDSSEPVQEVAEKAGLIVGPFVT